MTLRAGLRLALCAALLACPGEDRAASAALAGLELARAGKLAEAQERFAAALSLDPTNAIALYNGSLTLVGLGRYAEAEALLESFTRLHPKDALGWLELARVQRSLNRGEAAFAALQSSVDAGLDSQPELLRDDVFRPYYRDPRFLALQMVVARRGGVKPEGGVLEAGEGEEHYGTVPLRGLARPGPVRDGPCPPGRLASGEQTSCGAL